MTETRSPGLRWHEWDLRLAGDCLLTFSFVRLPDGSLGSAVYPEGWKTRLRDYDVSEHAVELMMRAYREGYNRAIRGDREGRMRL